MMHMDFVLPKSSLRFIVGSLCFIILVLHIMFNKGMYVVIFSVIIGLASYSIKYFSHPKLESSVYSHILSPPDSKEGALYAHRGAALDAPENTISAIVHTSKKRAWGVEIDMSFTKDSVAVLFHDDSVNRTTDGTGVLSEMSFDEIKDLDAAASHPFRQQFPKTRIPRLDQALELCLELDLRVIIDVKEYDFRAVEVINNMYERYPKLYERGLVASFFPNFIYALRSKNPKIPTALTWRPYFWSYQDIERTQPRSSNFVNQFLLENVVDPVYESLFHNVLWHITGSKAVLIHKDCISQNYVDLWKRRGVTVLVWTPNHPAAKDYFTKVLKIPIITDTLT